MVADDQQRWEERDARWQRWAEERDGRWEQWTAERDQKRTKWEEQRERGRQEWEERFATEQRQYNDEWFKRLARITTDQIAAIDEINRRSEANFVALQSEIADQRAEIREQTQALMRILDRLPPRRG